MTSLYLAILCHQLVGIVFLVSVWNKIIAPKHFRESLVDDFHFPSRWSYVGTVTIISLEILCFLLLLLSPLHGLLLSIVMLLIFSFGIAKILLNGETIFCRCFGNSHEPLSWLDLFRNGFYLATAFYALIHPALLSNSLSMSSHLAIGLLAIYIFIISINFNPLTKIFQRA